MSEIERRGYRARCTLDPTEFYGRYEHGFASGSPADRTAAFMELIRDDSVDAILAVRGAYGTLDLLPRLDYGAIAAARKVLIGCSDVTALLVQFASRCQIPSIHGPTLGSSFADAETADDARASVEQLLTVLADPSYRLNETCTVLRAGEGRGPILAGNLTMFQTLLGTPWDIDFDGAVLVLEDVGEAPYRIHRGLVQLAMAGKLSRLAALVFGRFARCTAAAGPTVDEVFEMIIRDYLGDTDYPVVKGLESGHYGRNVPLAIGCLAEVSGATFMTLESPIAER